MICDGIPSASHCVASDVVGRVGFEPKVKLAIMAFLRASSRASHWRCCSSGFVCFTVLLILDNVLTFGSIFGADDVDAAAGSGCVVRSEGGTVADNEGNSSSVTGCRR